MNLQQAFQYVRFGPNTQAVQMQCQQFQQAFPQFQVQAESINFPGEPPANYLVFKGVASSGHPLKIILPQNYPMAPPRIYFDMQMQQQTLMALPYVNKQSFQIEADSVKNWRANFTLAQAITDTCTTLLMQPPGGPQQMPQQQQPWGHQQVAQHQTPQMEQPQSYSQQHPSGQAGGNPQSLIGEIDQLNEQYFEQVTKAVNCLVDSKVAVHAHDKVLDDQIDDFKARLSTIDGNIESLQQENEHMQKVIAESSNSAEVNLENVDQHVFPSNPLSERLIKFHCKTASLEDAMVVVKKAFDSDRINLEEYLKTIRMLANKQCKTIIKMNRLISGTNNPDPQTAMPQPPVPQGQPGMAPQGQPGMVPQGQPGMMMPGQPGMAPQGQPGMMMPGGQPGMAPMGGQPGMMGQPQMMGQPGRPVMGQPGMMGQQYNQMTMGVGQAMSNLYYQQQQQQQFRK